MSTQTFLPDEDEPQQEFDRGARIMPQDRTHLLSPERQARLKEAAFQSAQADEERDRKSNRGALRRIYEATLEPALRGATRAVDNTSDFVVNQVGATINKKLGIYKLLGEQGEENFLQWYQVRNERGMNPLRVGDTFRNTHLGGPSDTTWEAAVEEITKFGVSFFGAGKLMGITKVAKGGATVKAALGGGQKFKDLLTVAGQGGSKASAAKAAFKMSLKELRFEAVRGGVADLFGMRGDEQRLADLMERYPPLQNPIQQMLKSNENDTEATGRIKNALEGVVLGAHVDALIGGVRVLRAMRAVTKAAKATDKAAINAAIDEAGDAFASQAELETRIARGEQEAGLDYVRVVSKEDGTAEVILRDPLDPEATFSISMDSNELIGTTAPGTEGMKAAVKIGDEVATGFSHDDAIRNHVIDQGVITGDEAIAKEVDRLLNEIPASADGFVDKDGVFRTRTETSEFLNELEQPSARMVFDDPEEATQVAAALEMIENSRTQQGFAEKLGGLAEEDAEQWLEVLKSVEVDFKAGNMDAVLSRMAQSPVNLRYIQNAGGATRSITAMAEVMGQNLPRQITDDEVVKMAEGLLPGLTGDEVVRAAAELFGESENLGARIFATRAYLTGIGQHAQQLSKLVHTTKGTAREINMARLTDLLDTMVDLQVLISGTAANQARTLRQYAIETTGRRVRDIPAAKVTEAKDELARATEAAKRAGSKGVDGQAAKQVADQRLDEATEALARLIGEETDSGISGARTAAGVGDETLPPGVRGGVEGAGPKEINPLTAAERQSELVRRANEIIEAETDRAGKLAKQEGLSSPLAPTARVSVKNMSMDEIDALTRMIFLSDSGNPAEILQQIIVPSAKSIASSATSFLHDPALTGMKKAWRALQFYRVNAMLSGPKTNIVNATSNFLATATRPIEKMMGGVLTGNREAVREGVDLMGGLFLHYGDSFRAARKTWTTGASGLDPTRSHLGHSIGDVADNHWLLNIVGAPGRLLMTGDEFASQMNYRSHLRATMLKQARREGIATGTARSEWVERHMRLGFGHDGQGIMQPSINFARENTFKADLGETGQAFEAYVRKSEIAQVVMPFRKTPLNLTKFAWDRTPGLNLMKKDYTEALSGSLGEAARIDAVGKMAWGGSVYGSAMLLAMQGNLVGSGPSDPKQKALWQAAGNRPYTIRVPGTDVQIDIRRMDPTFTAFAVIGDLADLWSEADDESVMELAAATMGSIAASAGDRTFFSGINEFLDAALSGDGNKVLRFLEGFGGSFSPALISQTNRDEQFREINGLVDRLKSRTWFMSTGLEPQRNIFGEPTMRPKFLLNRSLNPFTMNVQGTTVSEKVADELYNIGAGTAMPSPMMQFGEGDSATSIDLRTRGKWEPKSGGDQSPYDFWMLKMGSQTVGGRSLKERLFRKMETDSWKKASPEVRAQIAGALVQGAREVAWAKTLREYPGLLNEVTARKTLGGLGAIGADESKLQRVRDRFDVDERPAIRRFKGKLDALIK